MGLRSMFSVDYMRDIGTAFPIGIDSNHVGDAAYLTDGTNPESCFEHLCRRTFGNQCDDRANPDDSGMPDCNFRRRKFPIRGELLSGNGPERQHRRLRAQRP